MKSGESRALQHQEPSALGIIVDDARFDRERYAAAIRRCCGLELLLAANAYAALTILEDRAEEIAIVVSDERMQGMWGSELLDYVGRRWPHIKRVLLSAFTTGEMVAESPYLVLDKALDARVVADHVCCVLNP